MDKTKSKLAAFFDNDEEESSFPQKTVDDHKLSHYAQGTVRKSRREKEKEAADAKRKEEEEHAARAYAEFIDAFEGEDGGNKKSGGNFVKADTKDAYAPSIKLQSEGPSRLPRGFEDEDRRPSSPTLASAKPKGKRAMDSFLEEIKREQAERESRYSRRPQGRSVTAFAAYEGQTGSKDRGDAETSNVFVANLPPHVTEQSLGNFFARCGPVGSVKIMWPRGEGAAGPGGDMATTRKNKNAGLSGFVSFMKRKGAEAALRELDGFDWGGCVLRVGWSKAVPVAAKPMYTSSHTFNADERMRSRSGSPSFSGDKHLSHSGSHDRPHRSSRRSRSPSWSRSRSRSPLRGSRSPVRRGLNEDEEAVTDAFIRTVALEVRGHGAKYEASLRERERNNAKYAFMLNKNHRRHAFYRGLLEREDGIAPSFEDEASFQHFSIHINGYHSVYSTDSAEESERERCRKTTLGRLARKRFEAMLRAMSGKRGELARCMAFSLEHAEAAAEVSEIIVASLLVDGTPVPRKVARLHLICDILHNSAAPVPSAWKYRQEFQSKLGIVFDHFATIYHSFPGRITAETFKKQITAVVDIWDDWIMFPGDFTTELRARLEGEGSAATTTQVHVEETVNQANERQDKFVNRFKASTFQPAPVEVAAPDPTSNGDDDGEPMDESSDLDGETVDDVDGEPVDDVDGEPLMEDVDGEPIDDDVDGVPLDDDDAGGIDGDPMDDVDGAPIDV
ncbi:hypothetical protein PLICRDRAFT_155797 [Plicaturopsis crispa FD-325 SS-3]|nr:hypothetical protein PLICRDRAFT_155797 [Plicaturopsis crispa FD-325 SS-3]